MTDYKAIVDGLCQEAESCKDKNQSYVSQEDFDNFVSGTLASEDFRKLFLNTIMECAQKAAVIMMATNSKEDALKMLDISSFSQELMMFARICYEIGYRAKSNEDMEKMFNGSVLDTQEAV